jgi:hypothetical protein
MSFLVEGRLVLVMNLVVKARGARVWEAGPEAVAPMWMAALWTQTKQVTPCVQTASQSTTMPSFAARRMVARQLLMRRCAWLAQCRNGIHSRQHAHLPSRKILHGEEWRRAKIVGGIAASFQCKRIKKIRVLAILLVGKGNGSVWMQVPNSLSQVSLSRGLSQDLMSLGSRSLTAWMGIVGKTLMVAKSSVCREITGAP